MQQQHQSILSFSGGRYLKLALLLCAGAIGAYAWHEPPTASLKPYGGTWLGYTLGTIGALLILWLMLLGVRKRRYRAGVGTLQGWTSAHVYLGVSLVVIVTLHAAFEFGWNVHTLAYALMIAVIVSGLFGVFAYLHYPELITKNIADQTFESILVKTNELDQACRELALDLPDEINAVIIGASRAAERDVSEAAHFTLRPWRKVHCPTTEACDELKRLGLKLSGEQARLNGQLLKEMTRKRLLIERLRRDQRYHALLQLWLYLHVPLSFALLGALIAHVVSVFYFW
jgi:hypothetical protein